VLKKGIIIFLVFIFFFGVLPVSAQNSAGYIPYQTSLWIDSQPVETDVGYLTQNGSMLVPVKAVFEMMGAEVHWEPEEWKIRIKKEDRAITMYLNNYQCANGAKVEKMPAQPTIWKDTVMIPLRYAAEALGAVVVWNGVHGFYVSTTGEIPELHQPDRQDPKGAIQMKKTVVLDPGHGGSDPGAVAGNIKEKDLNLEVAMILRDMLAEAGITVYMTRTEDKYVGLYTRASIANNLNADLFVSIHHNASPDASSQGLMTLYYPTSKNQKMNGQKLAQIIQKNMVSVLKTRDWGIIARPNLVVTRETSMPAVIAELGFMTNKAELERMVTYQFKKLAAESLFNGIMEALQQ